MLAKNIPLTIKLIQNKKMSLEYSRNNIHHIARSIFHNILPCLIHMLEQFC